MKKALSLFIIALLFTAFACRKESNQKMIVDRDCTGVFLSKNSTNFKVCNFEKLADYPNGSTITVNYKKVDKCKKISVCTMVSRPYKESIKIISVK